MRYGRLSHPAEASGVGSIGIICIRVVAAIAVQ
jgi:hypothetical protein